MQRRYGRGRNYHHSNNKNRDNNVEECPPRYQNSNNSSSSSYSKTDNNIRVSNTSPNPGQRASFSGRQSSNSVLNHSASTLVPSLSQDNVESEHTRQGGVNKMMDSGSQGDFSSITSNDLATTQRVLSLIHKEFKVFECFSCSNNFGYQLKKDPNIKFCTTECLTAGLQKIDDILKGRISHLKSQDASPLHSPLVLTPSTRLNNGFSELGGGATKSPYFQNAVNGRNDDGVKARLLSTLQTGGGSNRNGRMVSTTSNNNNNSSDRGSGRLGGASKPSFNPSDNPFYRGEDRVDRARDEVDLKTVTLTQVELDAAFSRNPVKQATEKAGFSTIEQKEREGILKLARTPKNDVKAEEVPAKSNPLFEKPQLKTISSTSATKDLFKPSQVEPQIIKSEVGNTTVAPKIFKPQQQEQENIRPKLKTVQAPSLVTKVSSPIKTVWNMKNVLTSTSIYDLTPCIISFPWSSTKFTIAAVADEAKREELQMEVAKCRGASAMLRIPAVDDIVIALYEGDYYRGKIVKVDEKSKSASVSFIDFGDATEVKLSDCKEPTDEIMKNYPVYGVIFTLDLKDVKVPEDFELPTDIINLMDEQVTVKIESKENVDDWKGNLYLNDNRSLTDIIDKLLRPKVTPKPTPVTPAPKQPTNNGIPTLKTISKPAPAEVKTISKPAPAEVKTPTPSTSKTEVKAPPPSTSTLSKPTSEPKESQPAAAAPKRAPFMVKVGKSTQATKTTASPPPPVLSKYNVNAIKLSPLLDNEASIQLNYVWNMSKINISAIGDGDNLAILQGSIDVYVAKAPSLTKNPQVGDIVLAFYSGQYYRGKVAAIKDEGVHVIFLDYGDEVIAPLAEIKEPTDEIMAHPIYGVVLKIDGLPNDPHDDGNQDILDVLEAEGQLQVEEKTDNLTWQGEIWFDETKSWTSIIQGILKSQGN